MTCLHFQQQSAMDLIWPERMAISLVGSSGTKAPDIDNFDLSDGKDVSQYAFCMEKGRFIPILSLNSNRKFNQLISLLGNKAFQYIFPCG